MRNDRPVPLAVIERDQMHQLTSSARENLVAARRTLQEARSFPKLATVGKNQVWRCRLSRIFMKRHALPSRPSRRSEAVSYTHLTLPTTPYV